LAEVNCDAEGEIKQNLSQRVGYSPITVVHNVAAKIARGG